MQYDVSKEIELDLTHDESKYIELEIAGQKVKIPNWYSFGAYKEYVHSYEKSKNYRDAFCNLVFLMIKTANKKILIEDIVSLSDDDLKKIINLYLIDETEKSCYFHKYLKDDYFEAFYIANQQMLKNHIERNRNMINKTINHTVGIMSIGTQEQIESIRKSAENYLKTKINIMNQIKKNIIPNIEIYYRKFKEDEKKLAKRMIENGWYFTDKLPANTNNLVKTDDNTFNLEVSNFFEEQSEDMCKFILKSFPPREKILRKCFMAHKHGDYELCIPAMLAQADGISFELFGKYLFKKKHGQPLTKTQDKIKFTEDSFSDIPYYIQLSVIGQLNDNFDNSKRFNRHKVLHGMDIDYNQKINSLRCISILNFLAEIKSIYIVNKKVSQKS